MPSRGIDDQLARLVTLAKQPSSPETAVALRKALSGKSNVLAAKAARVVAQLKLRDLAPDLATAFARFIQGDDKGCLATTAIVKSLADMEIEDEATYFVGARHVQMEGGFGGMRDAAVELRCESVAALVRMNSRKMWEPLVDLLADDDAQARATAARALGATGEDQAKLLLRYKIRIGDKEAGVMGDCFSSILRLTRSLELIEPFLDARTPELFEAAALALGESRLPPAAKALIERANVPMDTESRRVLFLSIAMTRQAEAIEFLIGQLRVARRFDDALEALAIYRSDSTIRATIETVVREVAPEKLPAFTTRFT